MAVVLIGVTGIAVIGLLIAVAALITFGHKR